MRPSANKALLHGHFLVEDARSFQFLDAHPHRRARRKLDVGEFVSLDRGAPGAKVGHQPLLSCLAGEDGE
jgi:hypothetical protein